jgi:hypothetical protein
MIHAVKGGRKKNWLVADFRGGRLRLRSATRSPSMPNGGWLVTVYKQPLTYLSNQRAPLSIGDAIGKGKQVVRDQ